MTCRSKIAKIVPIGIQDGRHGDSLEDLFFASSPESKGKLTRNLVRSIGVTYRSKKFTSPEPKSELIQNLVGCIGNRHSGSVVERPLCGREVAGSIPGRVIPKTLKMVLAALSLGAQH